MSHALPWENDDLAPNGRPIRANFRNWFGASKAMDGQGQPLMLFHGSFSDISHFSPQGRDIGIHFGSANHASAAQFIGRRKTEGRIMPVYLAVDNPLRIDDVFRPGASGAYGVARELHRLGLFSDSQMQHLKELTHAKGEDHVLTSSRNKVWNAQQLIIDRLIEKGIDGLVYENAHEFVWRPPACWDDVKTDVVLNSTVGGSKAYIANWRHGPISWFGCGPTPQTAREDMLDRLRKKGGIPVLEDSWVVLRGDQVKSALGNCGLYVRGSASLTDHEHIEPVQRARKALEAIPPRGQLELFARP